jgi:membrane dipeptidase
LVLPITIPEGSRLSPAEARARYDEQLLRLLEVLARPAVRSVLAGPGEPPSGRVATVLAFEGADGFADDAEALGPWIERGACLVGLTHLRTNALAGSATEPDPARRTGLTTAGARLARFAYAHGALLDLAHLSDAAVREVTALAFEAHAPLVSSHTGARALASMERNLSDAQLRDVARSGGVVGVSFHGGHVGSEPGMPATLDDVAQHVEHVASVAGHAHVAMGSDLLGGIRGPSDAAGVALYPLLAERLRARGFGERELAAFASGNAWRVLRHAVTRGCGAQLGPPPT